MEVAGCKIYSGAPTVCLLVACLTSQQHASVSRGRVCSDKFTSCHTEIEVADQTFHLTQSRYAETGPTSPSADPIMPGAWQGSYWSANFQVNGMTRPGKISSQAGFEPRIFRSRGGRLNHLANEAVRWEGEGTATVQSPHTAPHPTQGGQTQHLPERSLLYHYRLVGLVVKTQGWNSACAGIFSGSSHTSDLKIGTPVATLPGAWRYSVSAGSGWPGVSIK